MIPPCAGSEFVKSILCLELVILIESKINDTQTHRLWSNSQEGGRVGTLMWLVRGCPLTRCATWAKSGFGGLAPQPITRQPYPTTCTKEFGENRPGTLDLGPSTLRKQPRQRQLDNHRQNENVRRFFLRPADLPRQGTDGPFQRLRPTPNFPPPSRAAPRPRLPEAKRRQTRTGVGNLSTGREGGLCFG